MSEIKEQDELKHRASQLSLPPFLRDVRWVISTSIYIYYGIFSMICVLTKTRFWNKKQDKIK